MVNNTSGLHTDAERVRPGHEHQLLAKGHGIHIIEVHPRDSAVIKDVLYGEACAQLALVERRGQGERPLHRAPVLIGERVVHRRFRRYVPVDRLCVVVEQLLCRVGRDVHAILYGRADYKGSMRDPAIPSWDRFRFEFRLVDPDVICSLNCILHQLRTQELYRPYRCKCLPNHPMRPMISSLRTMTWI